MFKTFTLSFNREIQGFDEEPLNRFLVNKVLKRWQSEFFQDGENRYWTVFLEYEPVIEPVAEKAVEGLDEPKKILLEKLRMWRKERADAHGVPVYIIGTNRELTDIVKTAPESLEALRAVKGFGAKYGFAAMNLNRAGCLYALKIR